MKIRITVGPGDRSQVTLRAETFEERVFLNRFFDGYCKRLAKRFPLKDKRYEKKWPEYVTGRWKERMARDEKYLREEGVNK